MINKNKCNLMVQNKYKKLLLIKCNKQKIYNMKKMIRNNNHKYKNK